MPREGGLEAWGGAGKYVPDHRPRKQYPHRWPTTGSSFRGEGGGWKGEGAREGDLGGTSDIESSNSSERVLVGGIAIKDNEMETPNHRKPLKYC